MPVKKSSRKLPALLSGGGYISRIGQGSQTPVVPIGMRSDSIPALGIEYKAVERALPPDFASVPIKLKAEAAKNADDLNTLLQAQHADFVAKNNLKPHQADLLMEDVRTVSDKVEENMRLDAMFYANPSNLRNLKNEIGAVVNNEKAARYKTDSRNVDKAWEAHNSKGTLTDYYVHPDTGEPVIYEGRVLTNSDYYDILNTRSRKDDELFAELIGSTEKDRNGKFAMNANTGTIKETQADLNNILGLITPNSSQTDVNKVLQDNLTVDDYNEYLQIERKGTGNENNKSAITRAKEFLASKWQTKLSAEGANGLRQAAMKDWMKSTIDGEDGNPITMEQAIARYGWNDKLKAYMDAYIQQFGENYAKGYLGVAEYYKTQFSRITDYRQMEKPSNSTGAGAGDETGIDALPRPVEVNKPYGVQQEKGYGPFETGHNTNLWVGFESSMQPPKNGEAVPSVDAEAGRYYVMEDAGWLGATFSMGDQVSYSGKPMQSPKTYISTPDNPILHVRNQTVLMATGDARDKNGNPVKALDKNQLVTIGNGTNAGVAESPEIRKDHLGLFVRQGDGTKVYVQHVAAEIYKQGSSTIIKPDTRMEALKKYGRNFSTEIPVENFVEEGGRLSAQGKSLLNSQLAVVNHKVYGPSILRDLAVIENGRTPEDANRQQTATYQTALQIYNLQQLENFLASSAGKKGKVEPTLKLRGHKTPLTVNQAKAMLNEVLIQANDVLAYEQWKRSQPQPKPTYTQNADERALNLGQK
jgi:hypothetical protein